MLPVALTCDGTCGGTATGTCGGTGGGTSIGVACGTCGGTTMVGGVTGRSGPPVVGCVGVAVGGVTVLPPV